MDLAIAYGLLKSRCRQSIERTERACSEACIAGILGARILIITGFGRATFDRAYSDHAFASRSALRAHRVVGERRMYGISVAARVRRTRLVIVGDIGIIVCRDKHSLNAIVAPTITRGLLRQRTIGRIGSRAGSIGLASIDGARIFVVTIGVVQTRRDLVGLFRAVNIERARSYLGRTNESKDCDERR